MGYRIEYDITDVGMIITVYAENIKSFYEKYKSLFEQEDFKIVEIKDNSITIICNYSKSEYGYLYCYNKLSILKNFLCNFYGGGST